jgi:glycosyltransferase involved in cell wall biosynthesis
VLTVIMPIAAVDEFLPSAIHSIQKQTFQDYICHILCRHLTEDELKRLSAIVSGDDRFVLHQLHLNGIAFALNYGLNLVKTKYVARMDGDDICYPTRFEKQLNFLEGNPNYVMVGCRVKLVDARGEEVNQKFRFFEDDHEIRQALKYRMPLCHPAITSRTDILLEYGGYTYGATAEDHELYMRIARNPNNMFKNLPDTLFNYRRHDNQLTNAHNAKEAYYNIGGFMFTEFLRTWNPAYLIGIVAVHPLSRQSRHLLRKLKGFLTSNNL